jgi:hypothetical protein
MLTESDRARAVEVEAESGSKPAVARLGELVDPTQLPGFIALLDGQRAGPCAQAAALGERYSMLSVTTRSRLAARGFG